MFSMFEVFQPDACSVAGRLAAGCLVGWGLGFATCAGCWLLVVGCWLSIVGCWVLAVECRLLVVTC